MKKIYMKPSMLMQHVAIHQMICESTSKAIDGVTDDKEDLLSRRRRRHNEWDDEEDEEDEEFAQ